MITLLLLSACADFPKLEEARSPEVDSAPFPKLVSLDGLLKAPEPRAQLEEIDQITARTEALRTRQTGDIEDTQAPANRVDALRARAEALRSIE